MLSKSYMDDFKRVTLFRLGIYLIVYLKNIICMGKNKDFKEHLERKSCIINGNNYYEDDDFDSWGQFIEIED